MNTNGTGNDDRQVKAADHRMTSGWKDGDGSDGGCGAECACGTVYDGFDSLKQATEMLDRHIARENGTEPPEPADGPVETAVDPKRAAFCDGLEQIAAFLREHPEAPLPSIKSYPHVGAGYEPTLRVYAMHENDGRDQRQIVADCARALGKVSKGLQVGDDPDFVVYRKLAGIWFVVQADREQVCERVVVGTETVEVEKPGCPQCGAEVVATSDNGRTCAVAGSSHYYAGPLGAHVVTEQREIVEWRCTPLLADTAKTGGAR